MADNNSLDFTVRIKDEGLDRLASGLEKVDQKVDALGAGAGSASQGLNALDGAAAQAGGELKNLATAEDRAEQQAKDLGAGTGSASQGVDALGDTAAKAAEDVRTLGAAIAQKTQAIKGGLALEQSEIELQRQHLTLAGQEQQAILTAARARGDEAAATGATNRLRQIEVDQLALVARGKRAEASAVQATTDARRQELAAVGPLTAAQMRELETSDNLAKSLRVQAAAAAVAAQRATELGNSTDQAAQKTEAFPGVLTKVAGAVAGAFAIDRVIQFGKSVNTVADEYKNLEARLRLAIGAQGDLQAAVQGVGGVAKDTYSNLDATVQLYSRLAASGKELNITNVEALALTKTINQSIQIGGASAQASEASVRQLIQGLQSGVIRGDEFNSIMEQAPRLAKAMADGLGVPVGALRGLAEQGQITSAKVVQALKGQSDAINKEFATIPVTTGRALENLNTQWTLFIGNLSGGAQQSSMVAAGINALAANLETLASVATRAGTVLTAALAIQGVQALRAFALEMATTGKAASLMSLELSKVPKVINITVAAVGFEVGFQIGEMLHQNSELARKLGVGMTAFMQNVVNDLVFLKDAAAAVFTSDTVDAAFERYRVRGREMDAIFSDMWKDAEQAPTKIGAAADAAAGKAGTMGAAAQAAGAQVAQAGAAGAAGMAQTSKAAESAAGAMSALLAAAAQPVAKVNAASQIAADLVEARKRGVDLDALMRKDLPEAIGKLSGAELVKFRQDFTSAMQLARETGKALQTGLRLIGEQAAQSLGVDVTLASNKASAGFNDANEKMRMLILSLPALKAAGIDTGQVVGEALSKMIDGAKNQAEVDAIRKRVVALRTELGAPVADGLLDQLKQKSLDLKDAIDQTKPGVNSLREAMKALGITSDESLKSTAKTAKDAYDAMTISGTASARELAAGFKAAADKAIAANEGIAPSWVAAGAAARGYTVEIDAAGKATLKAANDGTKAFGGQKDALVAATEAAKALADVYDKYKLQQTLSADLTDRQIGQLEKENALVEKRIKLERDRLQVDKDGFSTDKEGKRIVAGGDLNTLTGIAAFLKSAGVADEARARSIAREFADGNGNVQYMDNPGQKKYGGDTISMALLRAAEQYTFGIGGNGVGQTPSTIPNPSAQTVNVRITLPNGTTQLVQTNQDGSQALIAALQGAKLSSGMKIS